MRRLLAYAAIYLLWGGTYLAVRTVVLVTPPFSAAAVRFTLSGLILLAISRLQRDPWPTRTEWIDSAKLGLLMFTVNYACFFWAEQRLYSGIAAVVVSTLSVWMLIGESLLAKTRSFSAGSVAGALLGIAGVVFVSRNGEGVAAAGPVQTRLAIGALLVGNVCWAAGSIWSRALALPARQSTRAALQMTTGGAFLILLAAAAGESRLLPPALAHWSGITWACFVYLVFASIVAFTAYVWLLHHEPSNRVASYAYVNPLIALALGVGLAHERVGSRQMLGGGLVLLGVFTTLKARAAHR
jgi:drug/metabolite transporter (DMT)-like permease